LLTVEIIQEFFNGFASASGGVKDDCPHITMLANMRTNRKCDFSATLAPPARLTATQQTHSHVCKSADSLPRRVRAVLHGGDSNKQTQPKPNAVL
jgi:hypothetical protein